LWETHLRTAERDGEAAAEEDCSRPLSSANLTPRSPFPPRYLAAGTCRQNQLSRRGTLAYGLVIFGLCHPGLHELDRITQLWAGSRKTTPCLAPCQLRNVSSIRTTTNVLYRKPRPHLWCFSITPPSFTPHCLMSIPPGRLIIASTENLRGGYAFQARLIAGFTVAGFFAMARVSSSPVSARMFRDSAAGLSCVNSAFIPMIGRLAMSSRVTAR